MLWTFEGTWGEEDEDDDEKHNPRTLNESPEDSSDEFCDEQELLSVHTTTAGSRNGSNRSYPPRDEDESQPSSDVTFFW